MEKPRYCFHKTVRGHDVCPRPEGEKCQPTCPPNCDPKSAAHKAVKAFLAKGGADWLG